MFIEVEILPSCILIIHTKKTITVTVKISFNQLENIESED